MPQVLESNMELRGTVSMIFLIFLRRGRDRLCVLRKQLTIGKTKRNKVSQTILNNAHGALSNKICISLCSSFKYLCKYVVTYIIYILTHGLIAENDAYERFFYI